MPRPKLHTLTIADKDLDGICVDVSASVAKTLSASGALVSSNVATFDIPRHVSITSTADESGVTFTFTGTDRNGFSMTEDIAGPNATTVEGTKNFKTITSVAVDDALTSTKVDVGSAGSLESPWYIMNLTCTPFNVGFGIVPTSTGTITFTVQHTFNDVFETSFDESDADPFDHDTVAAKTAAIDGNYAFPVQAIRLEVASITADAVAEVKIIQAGK